MSEEQKLDRYGFYKQDKPKNKEEMKAMQIDEEEEPLKEKKWNVFIQEWDSRSKKNRNQIAELIKMGIPETIRGTAWTKILDIEHFPPGVDFHELITRPEEPFTVTINKDLNRSLPQIKDFSDEKRLLYLKHVLYAYGFVDPELGYTQGMNFIAGLLLHYLEEEDAFKCLYKIMYGPRTMHREFFTQGFPRLQIANKMLDLLLKKNYPKIVKNFEANGIVYDFFTSGWFMTAFMSFTWEPEFQMRIFERFMFYGLRGLLGFAIAIFSRHKDILATAQGLENILPILQRPDESERMFNWHYVIKKWDDHWISKSEYLKLLKAVGAPAEPMI